jgi:hypothetical protein
MQKRHEDTLTARMEKIWGYGWVFIFWWELYTWYDVQRIGKNVWRDLRDRFLEDNPKLKSEMHIYECDDGVLLVHPDELKSISKKIGEAPEIKI